MKFEPLSEQEERDLFLPLAAGKASFVIKKSDAHHSPSSGNDGIKIVLNVTDCNGTHGVVVDYLMNSKHPYPRMKIKAFCQSVGQVAMYEAGTIDPQSLEGLRGECMLEIETSEWNGKERHKAIVKSYSAPAATTSKTSAPPLKDTAAMAKIDDKEFSDDLPF
jgi:hypothetical protein